MSPGQSASTGIAPSSLTRDELLSHEHEFAPDVDKLTMESPAPVQADKDGKYPVPQPGVKKDREF